MPFLFALSGAALVTFALLDALWTTIVPRGADPLTKRIAWGGWVVSVWIHRRRPGGAHGLLALAGPAILVAGFPARVLLLWAGWTPARRPPPISENVIMNGAFGRAR